MDRFPSAILAIGAAAACLTPAAAGATTINLQSSAAVDLDGRWYFALPGSLAAEPVQGYTLNAPAGFSNCVRSNGQALVSNNRPLRWDNGAATIWLSTAINGDGSTGPQVLYLFDRPILRLRSSTGDLVCQGEVPAPPGLDTLFRWGFE